ncbi:MAG TPA: GntR family transcriptional regulator [Capsulimonadaceae bacterium]|jgi:DNA-binding LacI/PurR family transcriptional regulator
MVNIVADKIARARQSRAHRTAEYVVIANDIRTQIASGRLREGDLVPSFRELAQQFGVSVATVQQGIGVLVKEQALTVKPNRGVFVAGRLANQSGEIDAVGSSRHAYPAASVPLRSSRPHIGIVTCIAKNPQDRARDHDENVEYLPDYHGDSFRTMPGIIAGGIEKVASAAGGSTSLYDLSVRYEFTGEHVAHSMMRLLADGADAIAFAYVEPDTILAGLRLLSNWKLPLAAIVSVESRLPMPIVRYDHVDAGAKVGRHLLDTGCERLMCFGTSGDKWAVQRVEGVREAMRFAGCNPLTVRVEIQEQNKQMPVRDQAVRFASDVLSRGMEFDGVVAANDECAIGFMQTAEHFGLRVGRDYAIAGFDDIAEARWSNLTSVHVPLEDMGRECARVLINMVEGRPAASQTCVDSQLIVRSSSRRLQGGGIHS